MSQRLTKKQMLIMDFIRDFTESRGFPPSYREIMVGLNLNSVSAVAEHVDNLIMLGALRKKPGKPRSLEIIDNSHPETVELFRTALPQASPEEAAILAQAAQILGIELGGAD